MKWLPVFTSKKGLSGTLLFPIGLILSGFFFWDQSSSIFRASGLVLGFADSAACFVGLSMPSPKWRWWPQKSRYGSLAFFVVTFSVLFVMFGIQNIYLFPQILVASLTITCIESVFGNGTDNVVIPISTAALLEYLAIW